MLARAAVAAMSPISPPVSRLNNQADVRFCRPLRRGHRDNAPRIDFSISCCSLKSFYGSPPNVSLTKSLVLKPASGHIYSAIRYPSPPGRHRSVVLCETRESGNTISPQHPSSCQAAIKRSLKKIAVWGGGLSCNQSLI